MQNTRSNHIEFQFSQNSSDCEKTGIITQDEIDDIARYTIQKINNYPKSLGKTVENYFDLLFPDELKNYLIRRNVNGQLFVCVCKE